MTASTGATESLREAVDQPSWYHTRQEIVTRLEGIPHVGVRARPIG